MAILPNEEPQMNMAEWWQFKPLSIEWLYMMQKLKDSVMPPAGVAHCLIGEASDGESIYLLNKKFYTAQTIATATGLGKEALETHAGIITLRGKRQDGIPEATVSYWGTA